jgi:hypothetical protein
MLKMEVESNHSFREVLYPFPVHIIRLCAEGSAPLERSENSGLGTTVTICISFVLYAISAKDACRG